MKNYTWIYGLMLFLLVACKGQNQSETTQDFLFKMEFYPSFIPSSRVEIQKSGDESTLTIHKLFDAHNPRFKATGNEFIESKYQLLVNDTYLQFYGDSIFLRPLEQIPISNDDFQTFLQSLKNIDLGKQETLSKEGILDGITIYFSHRTDNDENNFSLRCPDPDDKEFVIIKSLFSLFESTFNKEETRNYIESLKGYFAFGLLVKHVSRDPLEYRFYSHLSTNEADEFYEWMDSLPMNEPIILDLSNFEGMGTMFYSDFVDLIEGNKDVFWLVSDHSIRQVKEIGVSKSRIFKSRESLKSALEAL